MPLLTQSGIDQIEIPKCSGLLPCRAGAPVELQVLVMIPIKSPAKGRWCINLGAMEGTAGILPPERARERTSDHCDRMVGSAADRQTHPQRGRRQQPH